MGKRTDGTGLGMAASSLAGIAAWRLRSTLAKRASRRMRGIVAAERRWSRELSGELQRLQRSGAPLGGGDDVRDLVLRTAMGLLGAE
jgi:hypothetical protein